RLTEALSAVGYRSLWVHPRYPVVRLEREDMSLDLGGIAKGYAADRALGILSARGVSRALVDGGGDLALGAPPPGQEGWLVSLPEGNRVRLAHSGVATSGDLHRFVMIDGVRYSHVVDPHSGLGVVDASIVTVVAPDASTADAISSALTVMDPQSGRALASSLEGVWAKVIGATSWTTGPYPDTDDSPNLRDPE
ncbi:MAG: FAD:protein FMN transferase, partial [Longimicrobiales bacterium]